MDELGFTFRAYAEDDKIIVHVKIDGAEAIFRYTDADAIAKLALNMKDIIDYAVDDYLLRKTFKDQLDNELDDWLKD